MIRENEIIFNKFIRLHLGELMPARVWHDKLKDLLDVWYKSLQDYRYDLDLVLFLT